MGEVLRKDNINDEKMYLVQKLLNEGKPKFKVARAVGYNGVDGLDRYAKSMGYTWNVSTKNYELKDSTKTVENPSERIMKILSMVEKGIDLSDIAKYFRMKGSEELAEYMKTKGYTWSVEKGNYIKKSIVFNENESNKDAFEGADAEYNNNDVDIIKLLQANRGKLIEILSYKSHKVIPRYLLKGMPVTKGFFISVEIDRLIKDFSREKNILQKDIIQTALIEFFQKYGFEQEVNAVIKS